MVPSYSVPVSGFFRPATRPIVTQPTKGAGTLRRAVRSEAFARIPGGRHMECAYYFRIPGGRHMECTYLLL